MKNFCDIKNSCRLFDGMTDGEAEKILNAPYCKSRLYEKDEYILHAGDEAESIGIVVCGSVCIIKEDFWGNRAIISKMTKGNIFAESFALGKMPLTVSAAAAEKSQVLLLNRDRLTENAFADKTGGKLMGNLMKICSLKNIMLTQKIEHLVKRTTRSKLLSYLSEQSERAGAATFLIPFNRRELADYLSVDRSAMSSELGRLRDEGFIEFKKNRFTLLKQEI